MLANDGTGPAGENAGPEPKRLKATPIPAESPAEAHEPTPNALVAASVGAAAVVAPAAGAAISNVVAGPTAAPVAAAAAAPATATAAASGVTNPEESRDGAILFPKNAIKRIMKLDEDVGQVQSEAVMLVRIMMTGAADCAGWASISFLAGSPTPLASSLPL